MSKYNILENLNDSNSDENENDLLAIATTATTTTPTNTLSKSLIIIDDSDRFYCRNDHSNRLAPNAIEQQDKILNHHYDYNDNDESYYRSRNNRQPIVRDNHETEDLIDYNNMNDNNINGSEISIHKQSISNNSTTLATNKKHNKLVNNTLSTADAYITDDTTMEIPLLQPNYNHMDGNDNRNDSSNNKASKIDCNFMRMFYFLLSLLLHHQFIATSPSHQHIMTIILVLIIIRLCTVLNNCPHSKYTETIFRIFQKVINRFE